MPIYEYQCKACGHTLEAFQKINEDLLTECPKCQKPDLQKLISSTSFQLKGTGWYATDFRNKPETKKEATNSPATETKTETPSDTSKPADDSAKT